MMSWEFAKIQIQSEDEIIKEHDAIMATRGLGIECLYFAAEIYRRRQSQISSSIRKMTIAITVLTAINVAVAVALLWTVI